MPADLSPLQSQLHALREEVRAIEKLRPQEGREVLPFGLPDLDNRLASQGLALGALHEFSGANLSHGDDAAATLFIAGIAARVRGAILWVVRRRDLFAPGLYQAGLDPASVIYAEARDDAELLALMEDGLRHGGLGAVIGEAKRVTMASTRRLQLAAEGGRTVAMLLKQPARQGEDPLVVPSAAVSRWSVASAPSVPVPWDGLGRACWRVACVRQRGGEPFELQVEAPDEAGCLALPAGLADRPVAAERAPLCAVG